MARTVINKFVVIEKMIKYLTNLMWIKVLYKTFILVRVFIQLSFLRIIVRVRDRESISLTNEVE